MNKINKFIWSVIAASMALLLSGCKYQLLHPSGYVAAEERTLILLCLAVMLCVVVPLMIAIVIFAIKYRASNTDATYLPDWGHSNKIEVTMWGIPVVIVIILGIFTGIYTFKLEPSRDLPSSVVGTQKPIMVDAVALDWKWLFIYPEYGVAAVNEIYAPVNRQVFLQL